MNSAMADGDTPMPDAKAAHAASRPREPLRPNFTLQQTLIGHSDAVVSVKFSADGLRLASASADKTAKIWDPFSGHCLVTLEGHTKGLSDLAWETSGRYICTASDDMTVRMWDTQSGACLRMLEGHTNVVFCCAFNPVMNTLVSGSYDETLRIWDTREGHCLKVVPAHGDPVTAVDVSRDGTLIVSCSYDSICRLWNAKTGACLKSLVDPESKALSFVAFSPNGKFVLAASLGGKLTLWEYEKSRVVKTYQGHDNKKHCVFAAFLVTDARAKRIVSGSEDHSIVIWDLNSKQVVQRIAGRPTGDAMGDGHCDMVLAVAAHPVHSIIASGALKQDCSVRLWGDTAGHADVASLFRRAGNGASAAAAVEDSHAANGIGLKAEVATA